MRGDSPSGPGPSQDSTRPGPGRDRLAPRTTASGRLIHLRVEAMHLRLHLGGTLSRNQLPQLL